MSDFDLQITQMDRKRHRTAVSTLVNQERRERGLPALRYATSLRVSAQAWAVSMSQRSRFGHGSGNQAFVVRALRFPFVVNSGLLRWQVAENLAFGTGSLSTPREIVKMWMGSPTHRAAMLGDWKYYGLWTQQDNPARPGIQPDGVTVVQHFGRRG